LTEISTLLGKMGEEKSVWWGSETRSGESSVVCARLWRRWPASVRPHWFWLVP
jgi:hypothetical protein